MQHILSVSYDEPLLITRKLILQQAGYKVTSALGFVDALQLCKHDTYDLFIIGHSLPRQDKEALLRQIRIGCNTPVLSLYRSNEGPIEGVDYALDASEGPQALVKLVRKALNRGLAESA